MREIKFRGKDEDGNWREGDLIYATLGAGQKPMIMDAYDEIDPANNMYEIRPDTVGQFTGLLDREGREIYEGDIVRVVHYGEESIHVIKYCDDMDYPAFDLWPHFDCESNGLSFCECERETTITVIGNAHDNPELLERMI